MTEDTEQPGKIIPPEMANFLSTDNLNTRLEKLINLTQENYNTQLKNQEIQLKNQEKQLTLLTNILESQNNVFKELKAEADNGEVLRLSGTATTTNFTIVNTITDPGHPIKAFELTNDGQNSIYVGFNVVLSGAGADIIDVTNDLNRFDLITSKESIKYSYNRQKIRNIYLLSQNGNTTYRLKLIW